MKKIVLRIYGFITLIAGVIITPWIAYNLYVEDISSNYETALTSGWVHSARLALGFSLGITMIVWGYRRMLGKPAYKAAVTYESMILDWWIVDDKIVKNLDTFYGDIEAYAAFMEFAITDEKRECGFSRIMILASSVGDASVYIENNSSHGFVGYIGGIAHEHIRNAALHMVKLAAEKASVMQGVQDHAEYFDHVSAPQQVRFAVQGKKGRYSIEMPEEKVTDEFSDFYSLYTAGQNIITGFRLLDQKLPQGEP